MDYNGSRGQVLVCRNLKKSTERFESGNLDAKKNTPQKNTPQKNTTQ